MSLRITGGEFRSQIIHAPKALVRPTTSFLREAIFNICQNQVKGSTFLDLFAGSGIMGIEALSRGAAYSVFVDRNKQSIAMIKKNIEKLQLQDHSLILFHPALVALERIKNKKIQFDLVYLDPPYDLLKKDPKWISTLLQKIVENDLLSSKATIFFEHPKIKEEINFVKGVQFIKKVRTKSFGNANVTQFFFDK